VPAVIRIIDWLLSLLRLPVGSAGLIRRIHPNLGLAYILEVCLFPHSEALVVDRNWTSRANCLLVHSIVSLYQGPTQYVRFRLQRCGLSVHLFVGLALNELI
jgi:hypothetical protein